jgi:hypothetical protein
MFTGLHLLAGRLQAQPSHALPELVPAYAEMPPTFWEQHQTGVVSGAMALALLAALAVWRLLRPKRNIILPPEKIARDALAKLLNVTEDGKVLSAVSQTLRRYVSSRFNLPDGELTTAEFTGNLARADQIDPPLAESLDRFLCECDVRKFSPAPAAAPMDAVNRALKLVEQAELLRASKPAKEVSGS